MPEQVYVDITPGVTDVPDTAWAEATPEGVYNILSERLAEVGEGVEGLSFREIANRVRMPEISVRTRQLLGRLAPELLVELDDEYHRQAKLRR